MFELVHEPAAVAAHLFAGGDGEEGQFGEGQGGEMAETDASDYLTGGMGDRG